MAVSVISIRIVTGISQNEHWEQITRENLQMTFDDISEKCKESRKAVKATEASLKNINQQIHYIGQYFANKPFFCTNAEIQEQALLL